MRAAIIGIGAIARMHARALGDIPGVSLVAASCRTESKGRSFAEEFGCSWHADAKAMIRREKPDLVTVATPSGAHLEAALAAIRRGIPVICEKPLEITLRRIDRMIAAADKAGWPLPESHYEACERFKRDARRLGSSLAIFGSPIPMPRPKP